MAGEGEGRREGGEGPPEDAEFAEYVEYLREKYPEGGIKDDESARRPHEKESAQSEESAESSSERARGNHAEQPDENEVKEGDAGRLEADNEGGRDEEFERLWERIKKRLESQAADERHGLDQERRNSGNGPPEERTQDDVKEEPKAPSEQLSRESEAAKKPELDGRGERAEVNGTGRVLGDDVREGEPPAQDRELDRPLSMENPAVRQRSEASSEIEGKAGASAESKGLYQSNTVRESKGLVDSSAVSEGSKAQRMVQADGVRSEVGEFKPSVEKELQQDGVRTNPQRREIEVVPTYSDESQLSQRSSVRMGSLDSRVTEGDSMTFGGATLGSTGAGTETKARSAEGGPPKESEPRLSNAEADARNLISRKLFDIEATVDSNGELGRGSAFERWHVRKDVSESHDDASLARKESRENDTAILASAGLQNSDPLSIRFQILKRDLEERTGMKIEPDRLYEIKGKVDGVFDFEVCRTVSNYFRVFVPVEYQPRVQLHRVYDVRITSVKEVPLTEAQREILLDWSRRRVPWNRITYRINHMKVNETGLSDEAKEGEKVGAKRNIWSEPEKPQSLTDIAVAFKLKALWQRSGAAPRIYFSIQNSSFEEKTGVKLEEGKSYLMKGQIEGVGNFQKILRSYAAGQDLQIYVPKESFSKAVAGKEYELMIDSIEKLPSKRDTWQGREPIGIADWTWRDVAAWIDTEGCIGASQKGNCYLTVTQKERKVLQELCAFLDKQGIQPKLRLLKGTGVYRVDVFGNDQMAKTIKNIEPYIRTENKKHQIEEFKDKLMAPRKSLRLRTRIAREILGLTEN